MDKRYNDEQRPLCLGDNNTCTRLADYKEMRNDKRRYHTRCSRHRRPKHIVKSLNNPKSKRYIPLVECAVCPAKIKLERHRVKRGMPYTPKQVIVLCKPCHDKMHKFEQVLNSKNFFIKRARILKNKFEQSLS